MSKKRKTKKPTLAPVGMASGNVDLGFADVPDPYEAGKTVRVIKNNATTPLDAEKARKSITEDQYEAGNRLLVLFAKTEIGGAKAIRYDIPKVDTSHSDKYVDIGADEARTRLNSISGYVGRKSFELLVSIVGNRVSVDSIASCEPAGWRRDRMSFHIRKCFSDSLQEVADFLGISARGKGRGLRAERMDDAA